MAAGLAQCLLKQEAEWFLSFSKVVTGWCGVVTGEKDQGASL